MSKYVYVIQDNNGIPAADVASSRAEAREVKKVYEDLYKVKCSIIRYAVDRKVR
jgi:hypothetical protein